MASWIGQPSHSGPRTFQDSRFTSPSSTNRPLRVPTSKATRSAMSFLRISPPALGRPRLSAVLGSAYPTAFGGGTTDDPWEARLPVHAERRCRRRPPVLRRRARRDLRLRDRGWRDPRRDGRL